MRIQPECIPCILNMTVSALRRIHLDEYAVQQFFTDILKFPSLSGNRWDVMSPEIIEQVMMKITGIVGDPDPFRTEKRSQNDLLLKAYPSLKNRIRESENPLRTAIQLAILGNSVDFMMAQSPSDVEAFLMEKLSIPLPEDPFNDFQNRMGRARLILYFGDNCGEIVLDRLLIETIRRDYMPRIVFVVRSIPTLNDATLTEAREAGIDQVAELMENGVNGPVPGTILNRCSLQIQELAGRADLIVSKGGGNFDTLGEEEAYLHKIVFMLLSKCRPYGGYFKAPLYHPILAFKGNDKKSLFSNMQFS